jgi:hypothetical protein
VDIHSLCIGLLGHGYDTDLRSGAREMKLLPIILLLLASSAMAKDYKEISVHRHGNVIVMVLMPEFQGGVQMICVGDQKTMEYRGIDCYPAIHQLRLPILNDDVRETETVLDRDGKPQRYMFPVRVGIPESMF